MTLYTNDYLEYYLTLVGWLVSNGVWNVLMDSGFFALPFLVIILQEWFNAREDGGGSDLAFAASARIEHRLWLAAAVILFAGVPFITLNLTTLEFDKSRSQQCQYLQPDPQDTGWGKSFTALNDQSAKVPLWWFFVHSISKAVSGAAVAAIPCGTDLRQMRMEVNNSRLKNPLLGQEVADFTNDCYGYSRAKLFMSRPPLTEEQTNDINWIGSRYFLEKPGYYDTYHSKTPRTEWPYDPDRDAGLAQVSGGGGYPTCNQWWNDEEKGLRDRVLSEVDSTLLERFEKWASFASKDEVNDALIRQVVSPRNQKMTQGQVYTDYGGRIGTSIPDFAARVTGAVGTTMGTLTNLPAMDVVRQALPMVMAFLKMALVICIPLVLVLGSYDLKAVITVSVVQFAMIFVDFWFQLARWIDSTIFDALYGLGSPHANLNPLMGLNNEQADFLLGLVMGAMFIIMPSFWMSALTWVGIRSGQILRGLTDGTSSAHQFGGAGKSILENTIKKSLNRIKKS
ncbi:conjugal transfer protein TraG N-terminal domain-containing protein [Pseudomonas gingeri]|uniref:conjugal transfer protein TraG N-terminal domain-containing protein n=1 Tax=Pseudomonas gingeri TaxID=117681 RepID=UPI0015A3BF62|nr:conjugal transfer protein TraG N-terminal domain-containing protein [Pseudomonas gingeri]NWA05393.1 conjugal transfer protein TraG N-terminal domain-containing protein [Pseudomonas gingeri]NWA17816.1 conjugal transfer protein TraG N-terminal domain-containing protein [Pseudomonas gingeri]NWA57780.1 conjugal transfer protein TraG N-terminal domain-containing protein [Pseudomonas gingeri]NWA98801.1 conjugal transfer protein TraG N-terminal domain-containing protein [Pseudomonas gingeri]NWB059